MPLTGSDGHLSRYNSINRITYLTVVWLYQEGVRLCLALLPCSKKVPGSIKDGWILLSVNICIDVVNSQPHCLNTQLTDYKITQNSKNDLFHKLRSFSFSVKKDNFSKSFSLVSELKMTNQFLK